MEYELKDAVETTVEPSAPPVSMPMNLLWPHMKNIRLYAILYTLTLNPLLDGLQLVNGK